MRKYIYIVFFFGISFFMKGQNSNLNVVNKKIESQFSKPVVIAYQNQAEKAIVDFYNYLNLYQLTTHDEAIKKEIDVSIRNLFLNENILLKNLIQPLDKEKALNEFLSECRQKNVSFQLLGFKKRLSFDTFFLFQYEIKVSENGNSNQYSIKQKVYFFPSEKHFGTQTKNVWQLKLGEIE